LDDITNNTYRIAIIGGTGKEGKGLAYRWVQAGYEVLIGSRDQKKANDAVESLMRILPDSLHHLLIPLENSEAVKKADIAVLTIPYAYHDEAIRKLKPYLQGKYFLDVSVPLVPPKVTVVKIPPHGSAAMEAQNILGENVKVISAFQNISFELLLSGEDIDCDVLVCGIDKGSREVGVKLVGDAGLIAWDAGDLENSIIAEGLTSILIGLNNKYGTHSAGIKITGIKRD
jgi:NADPH-dependent F420 reductase